MPRVQVALNVATMTAVRHWMAIEDRTASAMCGRLVTEALAQRAQPAPDQSGTPLPRTASDDRPPRAVATPP
jgi:hypothetical protein